MLDSQRDRRERALGQPHTRRRDGGVSVIVCQALEALWRAHRGSPPEAEAVTVARRIVRKHRPELAAAVEVESGYKGSLSVRLNGEPWFGIDHEGRRAYTNFEVAAEPPNVPPLDSSQFAEGHRRYRRGVASMAAVMRRQLRPRSCESRRRPRSSRARLSRVRRTPRASRAGPDDGAGEDPEPEGVRPELIGARS